MAEWTWRLQQAAGNLWKLRHHLDDESGVEVVEGVGMFILLMIMGFISIQFTILGHQMIVSAEAARQGARVAAHPLRIPCIVGLEMAVIPQNFWTIPQCGGCGGTGSPVTATATVLWPSFAILTNSGWERMGIGFLFFRTESTFRCEPQ